jgi:hypothetical protein
MERSETTELAEVVNVSRLQAVGGYRLSTAALLSTSFRRSRAMIDACREQRSALVFSDETCDPGALPASAPSAPGGALQIRARRRGERVYACVKASVQRQLTNSSATSGALWLRLGSTVQEYYKLCGHPPLRAPAFFRLNNDVIAASGRVWSELMMMQSVPAHRARNPRRACAHIRLSLPGEGWDQNGSPFTEEVVAQIRSLRPWLNRALARRLPTLLLSDAPWLLQRALPAIGEAGGGGCVGKGMCAFSDALMGTVLERGRGVAVSMHFRSAAAQLACAAADTVLLTPKSSFSKLIRMLAMQRADDAGVRFPAFAYTAAKVRFAAPLTRQPFLRHARGCAQLRGHRAESRTGAARDGDDDVDDEPRKRCILERVMRELAASNTA